MVESAFARIAESVPSITVRRGDIRVRAAHG